ncbi:hypothetical protein EMGBS5_08190 [Clavibacter sp.]|nr:hypothetical protein EMGBS5_08190 [Clavibacter sp.]
MSLSNIVDKAAPVGGEADFKVLEELADRESLISLQRIMLNLARY